MKLLKCVSILVKPLLFLGLLVSFLCSLIPTLHCSQLELNSKTLKFYKMKRHRLILRSLLIVAFSYVMYSCAVNPVSGKKELSLMSEEGNSAGETV